MRQTKNNHILPLLRDANAVGASHEPHTRRGITRREVLAKGGAALALVSLGGLTLRTQHASAANLSFSADTSYALQNPERGWFYDLRGYRTSNDERWYTKTELASIRDAQDVTLFRQYYQLYDWKTGYIPHSYLDQLEAMWERVRSVGGKIIPRFRYSWNTSRSMADASETWIMRHLDQLQPVIDRNWDVIDHLQAGFIGKWGEWHSSSNGHVRGGVVQPSGIRIAERLMTFMPCERSVAFRSPRYPCQIWGAAYPTEATAYSGTQKSRAGVHDDGFAHSYSGWGGYAGPRGERYYRGYAQACGAYTLTSGEPGQMTNYSKANFLAETRSFHLSSLNMNWGDPAVQRLYGWMKATPAIDGHTVWEICHRDFGYRIRLASASIPSTVAAGSALTMVLNFANDGLARPHNPRDLVLVFRNRSTGAIITRKYTAQDTRRVLPHGKQTSRLEWAPSVPSIAPAGTYDVALWLPDPKSSIRTRPEYAIRLANVGLWEPATGFNVLFRNLKVV